MNDDRVLQVRSGMIGNPQENEVKFYLTNPEEFLQRLTAIGANLKHERCHETDLRFDDSAGNLRTANRVLRLRQDDRARITYKGPGEVLDGVASRREIEVTVSDFDTARELLEAIGYQPCLLYEKYRTTYAFTDCEIVLDEMPFGWFCEIEGLSPVSIQQVAKYLALNWENRILDSYALLFGRCRDALGLAFSDMTFFNFKGITVTPQDLGVKPGNEKGRV
jgi:adenylate cyclase class 2